MYFGKGYNLGLSSAAESHSQCQIKIFTQGFGMHLG